MSSPSEVLAVKRRAAPKLFRTRRLANGQLVRTRAGPGVEAKFREIRDEMAESKRVRSITTEDDHASSTSSTGRSYAFTSDEPDHRHLAQKSRIAIIPAVVEANASPVEVQHYGSLPHINTSIAAPASAYRPQQRQSQVHPATAMPFWDRGRDYHASYLESINENAPSSWETGFSGLVESAPVTAAPAQVFTTPRDPSYRYATASFSGAFGSPTASPQAPFAIQQASAVSRFEPHFQPALPFNHHIAGLQGLSSIAIQSCPASIHTSPVSRAQDPPGHIPDFLTQDARNSNTPLKPPAQTTYRSPPPDPFAALRLQSLEGPPLTSDNGGGDQFLLSISPTPAPGPPDALGHRDRLAAALAAMSENSSLASSYEDISPLHSARPSVVWDQGDTIDPRWVSNANSAWTTPAVTPRSGSPVNGIPPYPQLQQGASHGF
jgi:hypothetical protein